MADYIYLLQTRLNAAQRAAMEHVRQVARDRGMTVFLVGGAVRDLTSGAPVRDLDFAVQGNASKIVKDLQKAGGVLLGSNDTLQAVYLNFPGGVRVAVESTLSVSYPKPGKPVAKPASILDDLRRRDFTANAMAISLNEGSFGLLMDPLNGVADIENRELRLVSNYGFIEDPARMIRAARLGARLGWQMEERTQQRYENGKTEGYLSAMTPAQAGYELEEVFHEEDPLRVMRRLEAEGWAKALSPVWSSGKANEPELERLRDTLGQLDSMGIHPDPSPAYFPLLTAKLNAKELATLKESFARQGFVAQVEALEGETKNFASAFSSKAAALPSDSWKMLFTAVPENVLWLAFSSKSGPVQSKFKAFFNDWPQARQRVPYQIMQEMRIHPELPGYAALVEDLFFAMMDAKLETPEAIKAFLEPFSPPAPPQVNTRRRAVKKETKAKSRSKKAREEEPIEPEAGLQASADESSTPAAVEVTTPSAVEKPVDTPERKAPTKKAAPAEKTSPASSKAHKEKSAAERPAAKKVPTPAVKKAAPAKKAAAKKATPVKVVAKKAAIKKAPAKAAPAKKVAAKKPAPKTPAKKVAAKKNAPKPAAKKAVPAKKAAKKAAPVKAAPKKATAAKKAAKPAKKVVKGRR